MLKPINTPHGLVAFWQVVGLTAADVAEARTTSTDELMSRWRAEGNPLLLTRRS